MYYAVVKKYATLDGVGFCDWFFRTKDHDGIYNKIMELTGNHDDAASAASWCEVASKNEIYEFADGTGEVEIQKID